MRGTIEGPVKDKAGWWHVKFAVGKTCAVQEKSIDTLGGASDKPMFEDPPMGSPAKTPKSAEAKGGTKRPPAKSSSSSSSSTSSSSSSSDSDEEEAPSVEVEEAAQSPPKKAKQHAKTDEIPVAKPSFYSQDDCNYAVLPESIRTEYPNIATTPNQNFHTVVRAAVKGKRAQLCKDAEEGKCMATNAWAVGSFMSRFLEEKEDGSRRILRFEDKTNKIKYFNTLDVTDNFVVDKMVYLGGVGEYFDSSLHHKGTNVVVSLKNIEM